MRSRVIGVGAVIMAVMGISVGRAGADDFLLADGKAWPGRLLQTRGSAPDLTPVFERNLQQDQGTIPKIRSITKLQDGRVVFCSGLDRRILELVPNGERVLHHGGYIARQVRTDSNGDLYWSGLETPIDGNPLPDGFIYKFDVITGQFQTLMTFSQNDLQKDWWGAFDVRQGRIYVATLKQPSSIYEIIDSIPRKIATLPISVTAFRFDQDKSLLVADGHGKLVRFPDLSTPEVRQTELESPIPFADFVRAR